MAYVARVDKRSCLCSGRCIDEAPEAFRLDEDQLAEAVPGAPIDPERLLQIARACPAIAIAVFDVHGNEVDL